MTELSKRKLPSHGQLGLIVLALSTYLMTTRTEPVYSFYYMFAWWSFILIVDGLIYKLKGNSLIVNRTSEFILLITWSIFIWLVFETFNFYLQNWHYIKLVRIQWLRWLGYLVAFGTVLPALFETTEFLETIGLYRNSRTKPLSQEKGWYRPFAMLGIASLVLPVIWPRYFFPLIWGAFIFLLEPVNHYFGGKSLMRDWEEGSLRKFYLLLTAGLICGFFWELWNFWAGSKWVYTVPFFDRLKIFEMPVAGYIGFPPFAVECYVMYNFICLLRGNKGWEEDSSHIKARTTNHLVWTGVAIVLLFTYLVIPEIDRKTVHSFARIFFK